MINHETIYIYYDINAPGHSKKNVCLGYFEIYYSYLKFSFLFWEYWN